MNFIRRSFAVIAMSSLGFALCVSAAHAAKPQAKKHPDLSGFWNISVKIQKDKAMMDLIPKGTAILEDTGAAEFPRGEYGGLKLKPATLAEAEKWDPKQDFTLSNACKAPSIVYALQGPFPIEIFQGTEFIVMKMEYFDMVRMIFMDGRKADENTPETKMGFSTGRWEGDMLVVETTHIAASTITNNGLNHSNKIRTLERFKLTPDGKGLMITQEFEDPETLDNRGARFIPFRKKSGEHVYPYECDPSFALEYQGDKK
jgi:hypothetical protein